MSIKPGGVVIDVGANYGAFARMALLKGASLVVMVELLPHNVSCLARTFDKEIGAGKASVVPKALWSEDDQRLLLESDLAKTWGRRSCKAMRAKGPGMPSRCVPLPWIVCKISWTSRGWTS